MVREDEVRTGEAVVTPPSATDAGLEFIGVIRTPWTSRLETPRLGRHDGPHCVIAARVIRIGTVNAGVSTPVTPSIRD